MASKIEFDGIDNILTSDPNDISVASTEIFGKKLDGQIALTIEIARIDKPFIWTMTPEIVRFLQAVILEWRNDHG